MTPPQGFGQSLLRPSAPVKAHPRMPNSSVAQPEGLELGPSVVQSPAQGGYLAREGPATPYTADPKANVYALGEPVHTEAAVKTLHVRRHGGDVWNVPGSTGTRAVSFVLPNKLTEAQLATSWPTSKCPSTVATRMI